MDERAPLLHLNEMEQMENETSEAPESEYVSEDVGHFGAVATVVDEGDSVEPGANDPEGPWQVGHDDFVPTMGAIKAKLFFSLVILVSVLALVLTVVVLTVTLVSEGNLGGQATTWYVLWLDIVLVVLLVFAAFMRVVSLVLRMIAMKDLADQRIYNASLAYELPLAFLFTSVVVLVLFLVWKDSVLLVNYPGLSDSSALNILQRLAYSLVICSGLLVGKAVCISLLAGVTLGPLRKLVAKCKTHDIILIHAEGSTVTEFMLSNTSRAMRSLSAAHERDGLLEASHVLAGKYIRRWGNGKDHLTKEDLENFLHRRGHRDAFMIKYDSDGDGRVSLPEFAAGLRSLFFDQLSLKADMASKTLLTRITDNLLTFLLALVVVLILMAACYLDVSVLVIGASSALLAIGFAYGSILEELFNSLHMLFIASPFRIGDVIQLDDGVELVVTDIGLLSSHFYCRDGYRIYMRNAEIVHKRISNKSKTRSVVISVNLSLFRAGTKEQMVALRLKLDEYFKASTVFSRHFEFSIVQIDPAFTYSALVRCRLKVAGAKWANRQTWIHHKGKLLQDLNNIVLRSGLVPMPPQQIVTITKEELAPMKGAPGWKEMPTPPMPPLQYA